MVHHYIKRTMNWCTIIYLCFLPRARAPPATRVRCARRGRAGPRVCGVIYVAQFKTPGKKVSFTLHIIHFLTLRRLYNTLFDTISSV